MTYFAQNLKHLRKKSSKTQEQLGHEINLGRTTIANYEAGASSPTDPEVLVKLSNLFQVSIDELLTRDLSLAFGNSNSSLREVAFAENNNPVENFIINKRILYENSSKTNPHLGLPKVIVVDCRGDEKMVFISVKEANNYLEKNEDVNYISSLPIYSFTKFSEDTYRVFEVNGDAMEPKFSHSDKVVAKWVSNIESIKDGNPYVIISKRTGLLMRRVLNKLRERNSLQLIADNSQYVGEYQFQELPIHEIREIWAIEYVVSSNLSQPVQNIYSKIAELELKVQAIMQNLPLKTANSFNEGNSPSK